MLPNALQERKVRMLRKRLQQHTGMTGKYVDRHIKSVARQPANPSEIISEEEDWDRLENAQKTDILLDETEHGMENYFDEPAGGEDKPTDTTATKRKSMGTEMEFNAGAAWAHAPKQSNLAKEEVQEAWMKEQLSLKEKLDLTDSFEFTWSPDDPSSTTLSLIAGLDLSFVKGTDHAVASLVVLRYPSLVVEYEGFTHCVCRNPYIPGFLAYREIPGLLQAVADLKKKRPDLQPQLWLLDGNGTIHHRGFGLACHFGVVTGYPTLGIAKNLLQVDGMSKDQVLRQIEDLPKGESVELWGNSGRVWGHALVTKPSEPIFVSPGHRVSLQAALSITANIWNLEEIKKKLPIPTRLADALSRSYIKKTEAQRGRRK
eukprot:TRINITY_DN2041_c3_g1_i1.p1 TRINITY_DN2041_c3_g1~~TRINITY_DN2041_c3_g1_i1.p1  ORF type:complete len:373 (+),score=62.46 TRINITY_DN2041_c3_g1_i1:25-1143(+)